MFFKSNYKAAVYDFCCISTPHRQKYVMLLYNDETRLVVALQSGGQSDGVRILLRQRMIVELLLLKWGRDEYYSYVQICLVTQSLKFKCVHYGTNFQ